VARCAKTTPVSFTKIVVAIVNNNLFRCVNVAKSVYGYSARSHSDQAAVRITIVIDKPSRSQQYGEGFAITRSDHAEILPCLAKRNLFLSAQTGSSSYEELYELTGFDRSSGENGSFELRIVVPINEHDFERAMWLKHVNIRAKMASKQFFLGDTEGTVSKSL
jgi:hypothetical protein